MAFHHSIKEYRALPYLVVVLGIIITLLIWLGFLLMELPQHLLDSLVPSLPWLILSGGILISVIIAFAVRLLQVNNERAKSYVIINENFQKEIAERIRTEETKQKLEKALLQGQKLQAMGTLAGGIAHDFNNLLYAIIGYVEMSREDVAKDSIVYSNLGKVLEASHRGQELIARILAFSRRQHHDFKRLCLRAMIEGVLSLLRPTIPASVIINLKEIPEDLEIMGDQTQLHQVIVNIINNAVDAMDGEGTVDIEISHVPKHDRLLKQLPKMADSNYCRIDIIDTGHGMDQVTMARIFEPFFTTKEVGKGTGLGLSTVHSIMQEHQGEVLVTSQLGRGTTFTLLLPEFKEKANG
jgi:signal transduction histidine kinase